MDSTMAFLSWCVFTIVLSVSLTGGSAIPRPGSDNTADIDNTVLLTGLVNAVTLPSISDGSSGDADTMLVLLDAGHQGDTAELQQRGSRRSAPGDVNLSDSPAAFVIAQDISGAQLADILQGLAGESTAAPVGIRCSGEQNTAASPTTYSEYTSETTPCPIPAIDNDNINTRGLCPWTYVYHTDVNRYPSTIAYAQCACTECVRQSVSDDFGCHPIYHSVKVLRKLACQDGIQIYESVYEPVPVACACLRSRE